MPPVNLGGVLNKTVHAKGLMDGNLLIKASYYCFSETSAEEHTKASNAISECVVSPCNLMI